MCRRLFVVLMLSLAALAQNPVGQLFSTDAKVTGAVELAAGGARVMSGSFLTAGAGTAVLRLDRGGEVRICSGTTLSVASSQSGRDLMLGLSLGCIETHYTVSAAADSVVTPDFRLLLAGPGRFDFAIEAGKNGDTCIRALPGNSSSLIVSELMGDGTYQVKPAERLVFHNGHIQNADHDNATCGCVSTPAVLKAATPPPESQPANTSQGATSPTTESGTANTSQGRASPIAESHPANTTPGGAPAHVEVDAPFVFRGDELAPPPMEQAITLHINHKPLPLIVLPPTTADVEAAKRNVPPPAVAKINKPKEGHFLGKVKSFFASIFR